ncbi:MAG TPA: hypothetical protein VLY84_00265 [Dysgonamonadaceae bacterium]|nr:hypothetical protein [Dysgonamonadaceae bacterium]
MSTTTAKNGTAKKSNSPLKKDEATKTENKVLAIAKPQVEETKKAEIEEKTKSMSDLLIPSAKARISRAETFGILADKHKKASNRYDDLTNFMASNDGTNAQMRFSADNNYSFTVKNPAVVQEILIVIESKLAQILAETEKEVLDFRI